jgi:hypothetical protein
MLDQQLVALMVRHSSNVLPLKPYECRKRSGAIKIRPELVRKIVYFCQKILLSTSELKTGEKKVNLAVRKKKGNLVRLKQSFLTESHHHHHSGK